MAEDEQQGQRNTRRFWIFTLVVIALLVILLSSRPREDITQPRDTSFSSPPPKKESTKRDTAKDDTVTVTVQVIGDKGVPFSGSIGSMSAGTATKEGTTPEHYSVKVKSGKNTIDSAGGTVHKTEGDNHKLKLQVIGEDGKTLGEQETTAPHGVVTVDGKPEK